MGMLPKKIENWSLTSLQQRLVRTGGRLIKHARYYRLMLAESHLTWRLFGSLVLRAAREPRPAGSETAPGRSNAARWTKGWLLGLY
jgi:hypothetical protein